MNKKHMKELIDFVGEIDKSDFNMSKYYHGNCQTPSCIAGHAAILSEEIPDNDFDNCSSDTNKAAYEAAKRYLDLTDNECEKLFMPNDGYYYNETMKSREGFITKKHALNCLRHFLETDEIDWIGTKGVKA